MIGIYKITSPSGRIYIGSSKDIARRFREHRRLAGNSQVKLHNSLKKYGPKNHVFEVIHECDISELLKLEFYYGTLYNVLSKNGLNCILPKHDDISVCMSDDTKKKISAANRGNKRPDLSLKNKERAGGTLSDKTKANMRVAQLGRKHPDYVKDKIRLANTGKPKTIEHRKNLSISKTNTGRKVINTKTGEIFMTCVAASASIGKNRSYISHRIAEGNMSHGFIYYSITM